MPGQDVDALIAKVRREAEASEFPIDEPVYRRAGRDPQHPILFAGSLNAPVGIVARDLGKDEVAAGQPLIGAGGRLVRVAILRAWGDPNPDEIRQPDGMPRPEVLEHALLTNTVPYKPPGNKAYAESVRRRFRPFLEELLARHWRGYHLITLGSEAFQWFEPYGDPDEWTARSKSDARFESSFRCRFPADGPDAKEIAVFPLPHPSPLNRRWYAKFPEMLLGRLSEIQRLLEDQTRS